MAEDISLPPGIALDQTGPIQRFLPPLESGSVMQALEGFGEVGGLVVDPFGASPTLVAEAAMAGRAVLVAANNPVNRFIIQLHTTPLEPSCLRAALARFANAPKDGKRLEPFLLDLYRTVCSRCGAMLSADYYIWDRDQGEPFLKGYACDRCGQKIEEQTSEVDRGLARSYSGRGLHYAMALEQLASPGDAYRKHAELALSVYPGRALYGVVTLVSKLNQLGFDARHMMAARALLLYVFDACNALWGYPEGRAHPRRLTLSPQYKESNVWRALERAVDAWTFEGSYIPTALWPSGDLPKAGSVAIYPGSARFLSRYLQPGLAQLLLTALPRPNQAYWTLAAIWTAWLWGRDAASPIKAAIRRRRHDWNWHARAILVVFRKVIELFGEKAPGIIFLPDVEPGFLGAALAGLNGAGFRLTGMALRVAEEQALLHLEADRSQSDQDSPPDLEALMAEAAKGVLQRRGEPSPFAVLHAAAWGELARKGHLATLWREEEGNPLSRLSDELEGVLRDDRIFHRIGRGAELESGLYWLVDSHEAENPLSDRVEELVLTSLRSEPILPGWRIFERIYQAFPGLLSPDRRYVEHCLHSYAEQEEQSDRWHLREEDQSAVRASDMAEMKALLAAIGERLDFTIEGEDALLWVDEEGGAKFRFRIQETAIIGDVLSSSDPLLIVVLPGGRASLVMERMRRDERLAGWAKEAGRLVKYRHVRRLAADTTLSRGNFMQRLAVDPLDHQDPQPPLL